MLTICASSVAVTFSSTTSELLLNAEMGRFGKGRHVGVDMNLQVPASGEAEIRHWVIYV